MRREAVLALLDRRREETGNPDLGWALEKKIVDLELADLEAAIADQESTEHALNQDTRPSKTNTQPRS